MRSIFGMRALIAAVNTKGTVCFYVLIAAAMLTAGSSASASFQNASIQVPSLKIVVIAGEDAVNVIQQTTAVDPVVEVRDRNDLPVAGAIVTFGVRGGRYATLRGGMKTVSVTTNAAGRASVSVTPTATGAVQIEVTASYQGQTVSTTITQSNFASVADAAKASPGQATAASGAAGGATASAGAAGGGLSGELIAVITGAAAAAAGGVLLASRGGEPPEPAAGGPTSPPPATTTARWSGLAPDGMIVEVNPGGQCPDEFDLELNLTMSGTSVTGTATLRLRKTTPGQSCSDVLGSVFTSGLTNGRVQSDAISFDLGNNAAYRFSGTFTDTRMTGTFSVTEFPQSGRFAVNRQ